MTRFDYCSWITFRLTSFNFSLGLIQCFKWNSDRGENITFVNLTSKKSTFLIPSPQVEIPPRRLAVRFGRSAISAKNCLIWLKDMSRNDDCLIFFASQNFHRIPTWARHLKIANYQYYSDSLAYFTQNPFKILSIAKISTVQHFFFYISIP